MEAKPLSETRLRQEHGCPELHSTIGKEGRIGRRRTRTSHIYRVLGLSPSPPLLPPTLLHVSHELSCVIPLLRVFRGFTLLLI